MMIIHPNELDQLEHVISSGSGLDEPTKNLLIDVIADRRTLMGLMERLRETPEDSRDEIFQEMKEFFDKR